MFLFITKVRLFQYFILFYGFLLRYLSTLKMEMIKFFQKSCYIRTSWRYIPEEGNSRILRL
jgi:hypothetical protein